MIIIHKSSKTCVLESINISAFSRSDVRHSLLKMRSLDSYMSGKRERRPTKASITTSPPLICANRAHVPDLIPIADSSCRWIKNRNCELWTCNKNKMLQIYSWIVLNICFREITITVWIIYNNTFCNFFSFVISRLFFLAIDFLKVFECFCHRLTKSLWHCQWK